MAPELSYDSIPGTHQGGRREGRGEEGTVVHEVGDETVMLIDEVAIDVSGLLVIFPREVLTTTAILHEREEGAVLSPANEDLREGEAGREREAGRRVKERERGVGEGGRREPLYLVPLPGDSHQCHNHSLCIHPKQNKSLSSCIP
jgi:hypothetical protein